VNRTPPLRALTFLGSTLLLFVVFEACSNNDDSATSAFSGPPSLSIAKLSFGPGTVAADGAPACGNPFGITLGINNWQLKQPGLCESTPQCGQVRVTLSKGSDTSPLATKIAVSAGVDLTLTAPLEAGSYAIEAELIVDDGRVYTSADAGSSSTKESFTLNPPVDCSNRVAGAAGASSSEAGAGGFGGAPPDLGAGGTSPDLGAGGSGEGGSGS
jgi:hypothetical protein